MSNKIDYVQLETVEQTLKLYVDDQETIDLVIKSLQKSTTSVEATEDPAEQPEGPEDGEKDTSPKKKSQWVILVSDPDKTIKKDLVGWVLQIPDDSDTALVVSNLKKSAYNFNASKKGNKYPVRSIGSALEGVPSKFFKPYDIKVKSKEPVFILTTDNVLPQS